MRGNTENGMTSPYLERPRRKIEDVLATKNMTKADIGMDDGSGPIGAAGRRGGGGTRRTLRASLMLAGLGMGILLVGVVHVLTAPDPETTIAEEAIDSLQSIAPAAGGTGD